MPVPSPPVFGTASPACSRPICRRASSEGCTSYFERCQANGSPGASPSAINASVGRLSSVAALLRMEEGFCRAGRVQGLILTPSSRHFCAPVNVFVKPKTVIIPVPLYEPFTEASRERMTTAALTRVPPHPRSGELAFAAFFSSDLVIGSPSRSRFAWLLKFIFSSFIAETNSARCRRSIQGRLIRPSSPDLRSGEARGALESRQSMTCSRQAE
jgi:hypothetical protein